MSRTVVITGGSKGIGWEIAQTFARDGYKVISGSRTTREDLPSDISKNIKQLVVDVKNKEDHLRLVEAAIEWGDKLDCYINNAGFSEWRSIDAIDNSFLTNIFETNIFK
jgi:3-oxoacyl-[acyl-carrier protein] reductase/meso-butanediol dehydrogenase/(S,S)-butanediol dehydrogenase/diacetyl reductase